jgi:hypothetical protein
MKPASAIFRFAVLAFYGLGFASLAIAHVCATVLAYHYVYAWKSSRALLWVLLTFLIPILSTIYWLVVHWLQSDVFWNALTLSCASAIGLIAAGMICESLRHIMFE